MKTIKIFTILAIALFFISNSVEAQIIDVCGNDSVKLHVSNYQYGTIQWESSYDSINWAIIKEVQDTVYKFKPAETKYYRAVVKFAECPPEYSEISLVQMPPIANAGTDRISPENELKMIANINQGALGTWSIIDGAGGDFNNINNPYAEFSGTEGLYTLVWSLTNVCGSSTDTIDIEFKNNVYIDAIAVVDSTDSILSTPAQMGNGIYIIDFSDPAPEISDSTVLLGLINDGFISKVDSFTLELDTFTLYTSDGTLEDIAIDATFDLAQVFKIDTTITSLKSSSLKQLNKFPTRKELTTNPKFKTGNYYYIVKTIPVYTYPGVSLRQNFNRKSNGESALIELNFNSTLFSIPNANLKLTGYYKFNPNMVVDVDYNSMHVKSFKMGLYNATIERNYRLDLSATAAANLLDYSFTLFSIKKDIFFVLAGGPVWIQAEFNVDGKISADISASMNVTHEYTKTSTYTAAIEYENKNWDYIYNKKSNVDMNNSFTVTGNLTQHFDVGPNIHFKVYGVVGPYIDTRLTEDLKLCFYNANWQANMNIGGEITLGAKSKILGATLFDISRTWSQSFYNLQLPYNLNIQSGNNQTYELGNALEKTVAVQVKSNKGFVIPYALVHFKTLDGGNVENTIVITNAKGIAETIWTPNGSSQSQLEAYILDCDGNDINNSPLIFTAFQNTSTNCSQSSLALSVIENNNIIKPIASMGTAPYEYSTDGINYTSTAPNIEITPGESYSFTVRDDAGCFANASYVSSADVCANTNIQLNTNTTGNVIEVNATGGTAPYQYAIDVSSFSTTNIFTNVAVGTHIIKVIDANTCINAANIEIFNDVVPVKAGFYVIQNHIQPNTSVQFINISNSADTYLWDFGDGTTSTQESPTHSYSSEANYSVQLIATNSYGSNTLIKNNYIIVSNNSSGGTVTDIDGNTYNTVWIGNQWWMAENLKSTKYTDGTAIPHITDNTAWANLGNNDTDKAYCFYNNDASLGYGALYTYAAAVNGTPQSGTNIVQGVCPTGWHLPSDAEWTELENYLIANGYNYDGTTSGDKVAKSLASTTGWNSSTNVGAVGNNQSINNSTGFTALPGGRRRSANGAFNNVGLSGFWWSSTERSSSRAWYRYLYYDYASVLRYYYNKSYGFSVRCLRD